jgi:hypothetical protein
MAGNRRSRAEKKPATQRLNAQIREGSLQRLMLHVVMLKQNPGDIISDLIDAHLREYRVQKNSATRAMVSESAEIDDQREESLQDAA